MAVLKGTKSRKYDREIRLYLREISKIPMLTVEEERELGYRVQQGDPVALQKLIESNLRFVIKIAKKYWGFGLPLLDLINEGNIGLIEAAKRFDPSKNVRFTSYAVWWIRQAILQTFYDMGRALRLPARITQMVYKAGLTFSRKNDELNRPPTLQEVAADLGVSAGDLSAMLILTGQAVSLAEPVDEDGHESLESTLEQTCVPSVERELVKQSVRHSLHNVLGELDEKEQEILRLRFGLEDDKPRTLRQIGYMIGLSRERVRQLQNKALKKLRQNTRAGELLRVRDCEV